MSNNLDLAITLKADAKGLVGEVRLSKDELNKLKVATGGASDGLDNYEKKTDKAQKQTKKLRTESKSLGERLNSLKHTLAGVAAAYGVMEIVRTADEYNNMNSSLRVLTGSQEQAITTQRQLLDLANETYTGVGSTVEMYTRFGHATKELGLSQFKLKSIVQAVNQSLRVSGATMQESASFSLQLAQGLGAGALQGEEFRAVSESNVRMLQLLADHLGVSTGALKQMAADGELTSRVLVDSLVGGFEQLNKEAALIAPTSDRAFGIFKNNLGQLIHEFDTLTDSSETLVGGIQAAANIVGYMADNVNLLENIMSSGLIVSVGLLTAWLYKQSAAYIASQTTVNLYTGATTRATVSTVAMTVATKGLRTAMAFLTGPIGLAIMAAGLLVWSKNAKDAADPTRQLKEASDELTKAVSENSQAMLNNVKIREEQEIASLNTKIERMQSEIEIMDQSTHRYHASVSAINKMLNIRLQHRVVLFNTNDALVKLNQSTEENTGSNNAAASSYQKVVDALNEERLMLTMTAKEQSIYNQVKKLDADAKPEQIADVKALAGALFKEQAALKAAAKAQKEYEKSVDNAIDAIEKENEAIFENSQTIVDATEDLLQGYRDEIELMQYSGRELEIQTALRAAHANSITHEDEKIRELAGTFYDLKEQQKQLADESSPFFTAWENGFKRLDTAGADFWGNLFSGAENSLDSIEDLLISWLAEMAHAMLTKPLMMNFQASVLGTGSAQGAAGQMGSNSLMSTDSLISAGGKIWDGFSSSASSGITRTMTTGFDAAGNPIQVLATPSSGGSSWLQGSQAGNIAFGGSSMLGGYVAGEVGGWNGVAAGTATTVGTTALAGAAGIGSAGATGLAGAGAALGAVPVVGWIAAAVAILASSGVFGSDADVTPDFNSLATKRRTFNNDDIGLGISSLGEEENGTYDPKAYAKGRFANLNFATQHDAFSSEEDAQQFAQALSDRYMTLETAVFNAFGEDVSEQIHSAMDNFNSGEFKEEDFSGMGDAEQAIRYIFDEIFQGVGRIADEEISKYEDIYKQALNSYGSIDAAISKFATSKGAFDAEGNTRSFENISNMIDTFALSASGLEEQLIEIASAGQMLGLESVSDDFATFMIDVDRIVGDGLQGTTEKIVYDFASKQRELDDLRSQYDTSYTNDMSQTSIFDTGPTASSATKALRDSIAALEHEMENASAVSFETSYSLEYTAQELLTLGSNLLTVNTALDNTNQTAFELTITGAKLAESLNAGAGGIDAFVTKVDFYYQNYFSAEERTADLLQNNILIIDDFNTAHETLGSVTAGSNNSLRAFIDSLDLTTDAGISAYNAAINLAPVFAQTTDAMMAMANSLGSIYSSAEKWQLDTFTDEQKSDYYSQRADEDYLALQGATGTAEIQALTSSIIGWGDKMWALLDDEGKSENLDGYLQAAYDVEAAAQDRMGLSDNELELIDFKPIEIAMKDSADSSAAIKIAAEAIEKAAAIMDQAADKSLVAANTETRVAVTVDVPDNEVGF